jgi:3-oxoacyl-[acyl-carrier protein] reductase
VSNTLSNKVALVTGGSRGIGAAIVRRLARDGAAVAFTYSASAAKAQALVKDIAAAGGKALALQADSADAGAVQQAVAQTAETFGRLDILVNNAGVLTHGTVDDFAIADFDRMVAVNVRAVFVGTQAAVRHMGQGGRVINIGSVSAERAGLAGARRCTA